MDRIEAGEARLYDFLEELRPALEKLYHSLLKAKEEDRGEMYAMESAESEQQSF